MSNGQKHESRGWLLSTITQATVERGSHMVYKTNAVKLLWTSLQALRQIPHASPLQCCCGEVLQPGQEHPEGEESLSGR